VLKMHPEFNMSLSGRLAEAWQITSLYQCGQTVFNSRETSL
jgi:hypothetical protein